MENQEHLDNFRKRLKGPENPVREPWKLKDKAALAISALALFVSGTTAYLNVIWQYDDIRVVVGRPPTAYINDNREVVLSGGLDLTFINSGNRAAVITRLSAQVRQVVDTDGDTLECSSASLSTLPLPLDFKPVPLVLSPGAIARVDSTVGDFLNLWTKDGQSGALLNKKAFQAKGGQEFIGCISLSVVVPDSYQDDWSQPVFKVMLNEDADTEDWPLFKPDTPIVILQRTGSVFTRVRTPEVPSIREMFRKARPNEAETTK